MSSPSTAEPVIRAIPMELQLELTEHLFKIVAHMVSHLGTVLGEYRPSGSACRRGDDAGVGAAVSRQHTALQRGSASQPGDPLADPRGRRIEP